MCFLTDADFLQGQAKMQEINPMLPVQLQLQDGQKEPNISRKNLLYQNNQTRKNTRIGKADL